MDSQRVAEGSAVMKLKIVQAGHPVLRQISRPLSAAEIKSVSTQQLIELMRETMRDAPGVGLAAPQIGLPIQVAVIEDRPEYTRDAEETRLEELERSPVPFHVLINPLLTVLDESSAEFFEGCLSVNGFGALVRRPTRVRVEYLDERAQPMTVEAKGWYARILQHEIDHLNGSLYIDRMEPRSFSTSENLGRFWQHETIEQIRAELSISGKE